MTSQQIVKETLTKLQEALNQQVLGQKRLISRLLIALLADGHLLVEGAPGLAKTRAVKALAQGIEGDFHRIQFTPDLLPGDLTGTDVYRPETGTFNFQPGPLFHPLILADEINRAPAKVQSALLEAMAERQVTIGGHTYPLPELFLVMATQNPIEQEGTYPLPEAQLDRFMFKVVADYPTQQEESRILELHSQQIDVAKRLDEEIETVTSGEEILEITAANAQVRVDPKLVDYINKLVRMTRQWPQFHLGASPRAGLALMQAARTLAAFCGRDYAVPDDVVQIALPVLRHRVILTAEAEVEQQSVDDLLTDMIRTVEVPRI